MIKGDEAHGEKQRGRERWQPRFQASLLPRKFRGLTTRVRAWQRNSVSRAGPPRLPVITAHLSECYSTRLGWVNSLPWCSSTSSGPRATTCGKERRSPAGLPALARRRSTGGGRADRSMQRWGHTNTFTRHRRVSVSSQGWLETPHHDRFSGMSNDC